MYALKNAFDAHDRNDSKSLDICEMRLLLESFDIEFEDDEEFRELFADMVGGCDGQATFDELVTWFTIFEAHTKFMKFDDDNSDSLEIDELHQLFQEMGINISAEDLEKAMQTGDSNANGSLSFDEFLPLYSVLYKAERDQKKHHAQILGHVNLATDLEKNPSVSF